MNMLEDASKVIVKEEDKKLSFCWTDMRYYTSDGFMNTQEYQSFPIIEISENYRDVTSDVALLHLDK